MTPIKKTRDIAKLKRIFILMQAFILCLTLAMALFMVGKNYLDKANQVWMEHIERMAQVVVQQLELNALQISSDPIALNNFVNKQFTESPGTNSQLLIFIINSLDGSYVLERKDFTQEANQLWESHRIKLIYQMQKQKRGWVYYPLLKPIDFLEDNKAVRYLTIDSLGWIVAVEARQKSIVESLQEVLTPKILVNILVVLFFSILFFKIIMDKFLVVIKKEDGDAVDPHFVNLSDEGIYAKPKTEKLRKPEKAQRKEEQDDEDDLQITIGTNRSKEMQDYLANQYEKPASLVTSIPANPQPSFVKTSPVEEMPVKPQFIVDNSLESKLDEKPKIILPQMKNVSPPVVKRVEEDVKTKIKVENQEHFSKEVSKQPLQHEVRESKPKMDNLTLDLEGIQSPVLRKMIQELRGK